MRSKKWVRPRLESLEQRWVPASIKYTSSLLTITMNRANTLDVTEVTGKPGYYLVEEGGNAVGTYRTRGITINGTNAGDTINVTFLDDAAGGLAGNLTIDSRSGNDVISVIGGSTNTPIVRGSVVVKMGNGNDQFYLADDSLLDVRGTTNVNGQLGLDQLYVAGLSVADATLTTLLVTDVDTVGIGDMLGTATIRGTATITPGTGAYPSNFTLGFAASINKLSYTGGPQADELFIGGTIPGLSSAGGDALYVDTGLGDDILEINGNVGDSSIGTGVTWKAGDGMDEIITGPTTEIGGDLNLYMASTVNDDGNVYNFITGTTIYGSLLISETTSNGFGNSGIGGNITFEGSVGQNISFLLGNNDYEIDFTLTAPGGTDPYEGYVSITNYTNDDTSFGFLPGSGFGPVLATFDLGDGTQIGIGEIILGEGDDVLTFINNDFDPFFLVGYDPLVDPFLSSIMDGGGGINTLNVPANYAGEIDLFPVNFS